MRLATSPGDELKKTNKVKPVGNLDMTGDELLGYYHDRLYGNADAEEDTPLEEEGNSAETASDEVPNMKVKTPPSREEFETLLVSVAASYQAELDRELQQEKARKTKSSLEVKVENGAKKTTPPLVKKKSLDVGLKDDVSEMEADEDDGDRQKLREIIREDPGIGVIAAKSVQKRARKARLASRRAENRNDPTKHTKPKKGSAYYRTADGKVKMGSTAANNPPYLDRMMEDGVPIKQWALVIGLLGLAILQLKKSILLPASTAPLAKKKSQSTKKTKGKKSEGSSSSKSQSRSNSSARTKSKMESSATSSTSAKTKKRPKKVTSSSKVKRNSKTSAPSTNGHSDSSVVEPTLIEEVSKKHVEETAMNNKAIEMALNDTNFDEGEWLTVKAGVASKPKVVAEQVSTSKPRAVTEQVSTSKPQAVAEQVSTSKPREIKTDTDNSHKAATAKVVSSEDQTLTGNMTSTGITANKNKPMALEKNHTVDPSEDAEIKLSETKKVKTVETPVATMSSSPISIEVDDAALARKLQMQEDLALQSEDAKSSVDSWEQVTTKKKKKP
eukprot:scaffold235046_cov48-Attheya_sp.AAC.1